MKKASNLLDAFALTHKSLRAIQGGSTGTVKFNDGPKQPIGGLNPGVPTTPPLATPTFRP